MSRYRFRFHECDGTVSDAGMVADAPDVSAARLIAIDRAREIMVGEVLKGRLCLSCWIVISDERGDNVHTLQFRDAIEMPSSACDHETRAEALRAP